MKNRRKVRNYLIDPVFQSRFAASTLLIITVFALAVGAFSYFYLTELLDTIAHLSELPDATRVLVQQEVGSFFGRLLVMLIFFLVVAFTYIILQTHKISGAQYAICRHISTKLERKDFDSELILRDGDYLRDVASALNRLSKQLRES